MKGFVLFFLMFISCNRISQEESRTLRRAATMLDALQFTDSLAVYVPRTALPRYDSLQRGVDLVDTLLLKESDLAMIMAIQPQKCNEAIRSMAEWISQDTLILTKLTFWQALYPKKDLLAYFIGMHYAGTNQNKLAVEWLNKAIALYPEMEEYREQKAKVLLKLKKYTEAEEAYQHILTFTANPEPYQYALYMIYRLNSKNKEAVVSLRSAIASLKMQDNSSKKEVEHFKLEHSERAGKIISYEKELLEFQNELGN